MIFPPINQGLLNHNKEQKIFIYIKLIDYCQVFLVAGGCCSISSTETLVEGGQAWNFQQPLPSGRYGLRGISLPNTVIMTGKKVLTFTFNRQTQPIVFSAICSITYFAKLFILHKMIYFRK